MGEDIRWLIGLAGTFGLALIAAFRSLSASMKAGDDALHERINRTRDDYVRRVDFDGLISQLRGDMKELRNETREIGRETNKRLDQVLAGITQDKK